MFILNILTPLGQKTFATTHRMTNARTIMGSCPGLNPSLRANDMLDPVGAMLSDSEVALVMGPVEEKLSNNLLPIITSLPNPFQLMHQLKVNRMWKPASNNITFPKRPLTVWE